MNENNNNGGTTTLDPVQTQNRAATREDAVTLANTYSAIISAEKRMAKAKAELEKHLAPVTGLDQQEKIDELVEAFDDASTQYADALVECRRVIAGLPNGVSAPGGANRLTVVAECYGVIDSTGRAVTTAADARKINKRSFAV